MPAAVIKCTHDARPRAEGITGHRPPATDHSVLNVTIGSTRVAFLAGSHVANNATSPSNTAVPANVNGSHRCTPYNIDTRARLATSAITRPSTTPITTRIRLSPTSSRM